MSYICHIYRKVELIRKLLHIGFIIIALCTVACVERVDVGLLENSSKLVIYSEIDPDQAVIAKISTSAVVNTDQAITFPEDVQVFLTGEGLQNGDLGFIYRKDQGVYIARNSSFRPKIGGQYNIVAYIPDSPLDTVRSSTSIPLQIYIVNQQVSNLEKVKNETTESVDYYFNLSIELSSFPEGARYVQIIPQSHIVEYAYNGGGEYYETNGEIQNLQIVNIEHSAKVANKLYHKDGIFVDLNGLSSNTLNIRVSTLNLIDEAHFKIKNINYKVTSLTEEAFKYNRTLSKQLESNASAVSSPITNYSNIENGLGIFAGSSSHIQEFTFQ